MATLFQKLRTLFRANLHELADRAIEKSDLAVYDDYIRQAERALESFKKTIAPMIAQVATTRRRREALAEQAARLDLAVDQFLMKGQRTEAMSQKRLSSTRSWSKPTTARWSGSPPPSSRTWRRSWKGGWPRRQGTKSWASCCSSPSKQSTRAMRSLDNLMGKATVTWPAARHPPPPDHADAAWEVQASSSQSA